MAHSTSRNPNIFAQLWEMMNGFCTLITGLLAISMGSFNGMGSCNHQPLDCCVVGICQKNKYEETRDDHETYIGAIASIYDSLKMLVVTLLGGNYCEDACSSEQCQTSVLMNDIRCDFNAFSSMESHQPIHISK